MWATILPVIGTLTGLLVGIFAEPLKTRFERTAQTRQIRAQRCEEFVAAATNQYSVKADHAMKLSGVFNPLFSYGDAESVRTVFEAAITYAEKTRTLVAAIHLYGPDDLAEAAMAVSHVIEGTKWDLKGGQMSQKELTVALEGYRREFRKSLDEFVRIARKHVRK